MIIIQINKDKLLKIPSIHVILNDKNFGFAIANNQATSSASGQYLLFLNPDTIIDNSIPKAFKYIKANKGFVGFKLLDPDLTPQPSCGRFLKLPLLFIFLFCKGDSFGITKYSPKTSCIVDWVSAAAMLVSKEDFLDLAGFDENIFLYFEEVDLLYRANKKGIPCRFFSDSAIIHYGSKITGRDNSVLNSYRGLVFFYRKHFNKLNQSLLLILLYIKAAISLCYGNIMSNRKIVSNYQKALIAIKL